MQGRTKRAAALKTMSRNEPYLHVRTKRASMVRCMEPTTKILLAHYGRLYKRGEPGNLADLIFNIVFVRNTMSKEVGKMCGEARIPWLHVEQGKVAEQSQKDADQCSWRSVAASSFATSNP